MKKGAASGRAEWMSERCHAMECCRGTGGPSRAQDRQLRDRASLFVMGNQCSGPNRIELTSGTWLYPAHISLAALNRPASSLAATFLTLPTLHSHSKLRLAS
ncbi:hypothetical protein JHK87_051795 [Glycine soja]|nr:hypothetical protein JHK87_051795 [Glycine soja]